MGELPTGTVTFLFTDIEGSTRHWEEHPQAMQPALARHDALLTEVIHQHGGVVIKSRGEGDSFFAVFARATDALLAACALQEALLAEPWPPEAPLRVRLALHTGEAELRGGDYYGAAVNRCARLRAAGHGGQVLLSEAAQTLVRDEMPPGAALKALGSHRLRDLQHAEPIYQLLHPHLPADFPPLRTLSTHPNNLPQPVTSFIGREAAMAELKRLLATMRLLTLTGTGGAGKTRLALQVAADLLPEYPDGVWLVELAPLADPVLVPQTVAAVLGVREEPGRPLTQTLVDVLTPKRLLLVLDNCEHLLAAGAALAEALLRACPSVQLLVTSREGLSIAGEQTYRVPSLSLPKGRELLTPERLQECEAVRLFADRAALVQPSFAVTAVNATAVAQVCRRLDGIPLAIELAAARVKALPVDKLNARLDDMFRLLTGGSRTALPRQQTLRALIDWSYDLLSAPEQALLRRLSVFAGGWTLEAAETVCIGDGVEAWEVLDLLISLVEKSLVLYEEQGGEERYRLLETVRQYARDRLLEAGEAEAVRERHRDWCLTLAELESEGESETARLDRLEREHDNLRVALGWSSAQGQAEAGLQLGVALYWFWFVRGYWTEGREHLARFLALPGAEPRTTARANAASGEGFLARVQGDYRAARGLSEESLAIFHELEDKEGIAFSLRDLGCLARDQGDHEAAQALFGESLALFQELGSKGTVAWLLNDLGDVAHYQGECGAARVLVEESLALFQELGSKGGTAWSLGQLGCILRDQGEYGAARAHLEESLALFRELGHKHGMVHDLDGLAAVAAAQGQGERAARQFAATQGLREAMGVPLTPAERAEHDRSVAAVRAALGEEAFSVAWAEGRALSLEEAVCVALEADGG